MNRRGPSRLLLLLLLIGLLPVSAVLAQGAATAVNIAYAEAIVFPDQPGLTLRLYFTPIGNNRKAVLGPPIRSAEIVLDPADGGAYKAEVSKAEGPIEIMMVLDVSGSMGRELPIMQTAARELIQSFSDEARVTLFAFNNEVVLVQESTNDKNRLAAAVAATSRVFRQGGGTCLYDATFTALERLGALGTKGRRAVIVFSDGVDMRSANDRRPCSTRTLGDVTQLATARQLRVPIYTIGFQGAPNEPIDEAGLRGMAESTGGASSIGNDIPSLFKEINDALNAQLVAEAVVFPGIGDKIAQLRVLMNDGSLLEPDSEVFTSPQDFSAKTPTPTNTFTPLPPVSFNPIVPNFDPATREFVIEISGVVSEEQIKEYRVDLISGSGARLVGRVVPAPIREPIRLAVPDIGPQKMTILIGAYSPDGRVLFSLDAPVEYQPTPTPSPTATLTPQPVGVQINSFRYVDEALQDELLLDLILASPERIDHLRVRFLDAGNVQRLEAPFIQVAPQIVVRLEGLRAGKYLLLVDALTTDNQPIGQTARAEFEHTRQPTPTPTLPPSPTPIVVQIALRTVAPDRANEQLILQLETVNGQQIRRYEIDLINADTRELVTQRTIDVQNPAEVRISYAGLAAGKYAIVLRALDGEGNRLATSQGDFVFVFQPPTPTPTIEPTPTQTPLPNDLISQISRSIEDPDRRPVVLGIFGVMALGLVLVAVVLLRPRKRSGTNFLSQMTGAVDISKLQGSSGKPAGPAAPAASKPASGKRSSVDETAVGVATGDDRTSAVPHMTMPAANLVVESTRHGPMQGRTVPVTHTPFTLGRKTRDANFDTDDNVSRAHAELIYDNGQFFVQDTGSTHGTFVDEVRIAANVRTPIYSGTRIRLGTTTVLRVDFGDPDKTNAEGMPSYRR